MDTQAWVMGGLVLALVIAGTLLALYGPMEVATAVWGLAGGLLTRRGVLGPAK